MFSKHSVQYSLLSVIAIFLIVSWITIDLSTLISAQPTASLENLFAGNKLEETGRNKMIPTKDPVDLSFQQLISTKPQESIIIGEIKPNASDMEKMLLRTKIANTIQSMQLEKQRDAATSSPNGGSVATGVATAPSSTSISSASAPGMINVFNDQQRAPIATGAECYIEVTTVEKVPGKCHRASTGLPICQSANYMTFSKECS